MTHFQAFKAEDGKYRWRLLDENGQVVPLGIRVDRRWRFTGKKRAAVEKALDGALARMAAEDAKRRAKA